MSPDCFTGGCPVQDGTCQKNKRRRHVVTIDGYEDVPPNDEVSLLKVREACPAIA